MEHGASESSQETEGLLVLLGIAQAQRMLPELSLCLADVTWGLLTAQQLGECL